MTSARPGSPRIGVWTRSRAKYSRSGRPDLSGLDLTTDADPDRRVADGGCGGRRGYRSVGVSFTALPEDRPSDASGRVGSNSSTGLPDGSSSKICLPPNSGDDVVAEADAGRA